ncbi:MAG: rhodanese-like domain-containing protein [Cyanobacteria bacterium P01_H01_bin.121]
MSLAQLKHNSIGVISLLVGFTLLALSIWLYGELAASRRVAELATGGSVCKGTTISRVAKTLRQQPRPVAWSGLKAFIRCQFPTVPQMTTAELAALLPTDSASLPTGDSAPLKIQLLDTRTKAEFAVSHLPGAIHVPDLAAAQAADLNPNVLTIAYCSVGYRSAKLVEQLAAAGFQNVVNLEGSLFEWANEGRLMIHTGQATRAVHPFNESWGWFLEPTP